MKLRVYLDTSVFSAYLDERLPDRQAETVEFWERLAHFEVTTSEMCRTEMEATPDETRRAELLELLGGIGVYEVTEEMQQVAWHYVEAGIFTDLMLRDAIHLAAAVLGGADVLVSWNFRHLVNRRRRVMVAEANAQLDLPSIEIVAPPEMWGA